MISAYIITEKGNAYTTEGLKYVTNMLKENYKITDELIFNMGSNLNEPELLITELKTNKNTAVIISTSEKIMAVYGKDGIEDIINILLDNKNKNKTSWQILHDATTSD